MRWIEPAQFGFDRHRPGLYLMPRTTRNLSSAVRRSTGIAARQVASPRPQSVEIDPTLNRRGCTPCSNPDLLDLVASIMPAHNAVTPGALPGDATSFRYAAPRRS